jgi:cell division protease FtsH
MLSTLLAGHTAEELIFNEVTTGAQSDIEQATKLARKMVTDYGMSDEMGPRTFGQKEEMVFLGREISEQRDYSDKVAEQIDDEVYKIIQRAHEVAKKILIENKERLVYMAERLVIQETLEGEELESLLGEPIPTTPPEAIAKPEPKPATAKTKAKPVAKKAPPIPQIHPKQAPATPD